LMGSVMQTVQWDEFHVVCGGVNWPLVRFRMEHLREMLRSEAFSLLNFVWFIAT
jgi:hypothetical protein